MASNIETEILTGYANKAANLLSAKYAEYSENDVVKLAEYLIDQDIHRAELTKSAALYDHAGRELARQLIKEGNFAQWGKSVDSLVSTIGNKLGKSKEWVLAKLKQNQNKAVKDPSISGYGPRNNKGGNDFLMYGDEATGSGGALVPVEQTAPTVVGKGLKENERKSSILEQLGDLIKQKEFLIGAGAGGLGGYMLGSD